MLFASANSTFNCSWNQLWWAYVLLVSSHLWQINTVVVVVVVVVVELDRIITHSLVGWVLVRKRLRTNSKRTTNERQYTSHLSSCATSVEQSVDIHRQWLAARFPSCIIYTHEVGAYHATRWWRLMAAANQGHNDACLDEGCSFFRRQVGLRCVKASQWTAWRILTPHFRHTGLAVRYHYLMTKLPDVKGPVPYLAFAHWLLSLPPISSSFTVQQQRYLFAILAEYQRGVSPSKLVPKRNTKLMQCIT